MRVQLAHWAHAGAIMGLAGAQLVFNLRHKGHFSKAVDPLLDQATESMLISLGITLAWGLFSRHIDNWSAHPHPHHHLDLLLIFICIFLHLHTQTPGLSNHMLW